MKARALARSADPLVPGSSGASTHRGQVRSRCCHSALDALRDLLISGPFYLIPPQHPPLTLIFRLALPFRDDAGCLRRRFPVGRGWRYSGNPAVAQRAPWTQVIAAE